MKKLIFTFALSFLTSPLFAQDAGLPSTEAVSPAVQETVVEPNLEAGSDREAPVATGCEADVFRFLRLCGERFNRTVCSYGDYETAGGSRCSANYQIRRLVCDKEGQFDESKVKCSSSDGFLIRR